MSARSEALTADELQQVVDAWQAHGRSRSAAARSLGLKDGTYRSRLERALNQGFEPAPQAPAHDAGDFEAPHLPSEDRPAEQVLADMEREFRRKERAERARELIDITIKADGPYAVVPIGDPHLDNPGCDIPKLRRDVEIIRDTPGMFGGSVGDYRDNWVGRLSKLFAEHKMSQSESLVVTEWFFRQVKWLFLLYGNHDLWSGHNDPLPYIHRLAEQPGVLEKYDLRLRLNHPSGEPVYCRVRHDFPGQSQYNDAHGQVRETLFGRADHLMLCGDRHVSAYAPIWNVNHDMLCHAMRVGAYKRFDPYPKERGLKGVSWAPSMAAVVNPYARSQLDFIQPFFDLELAADYLTWLRDRWQHGRL